MEPMFHLTGSSVTDLTHFGGNVSASLCCYGCSMKTMQTTYLSHGGNSWTKATLKPAARSPLGL